MKITLMEDATLYINKNNQYKVEIGNNIVLFENDSELEELKQKSKYFFVLEKVTHENEKCVLNYEIEEGYQSFFKAKKYSKVIRLSLLERVLEIDPLSNFNEKVLLHPQNIYFKDLKTIKFLYRSNRFLPSVKNLAEIDQYKLLILSMLSKYSYEQLKIKRIELLEKEKDDFLYKIENANTIVEIHELISKRLFEDETVFFKNLEADKKKNKIGKIKSRLIACSTIGLIIAISIITNVVQMKNYSIAATKQIENANNSGQAYEFLAEGKTDQGIQKLKETNPSNVKLAEAYFIAKEYDNAINLEEDYAKKVVSSLYASKEESKILDLKTNNKYIKVEKDILGSDRNSLAIDKAVVQDKDQLTRIGNAFLKNKEIATAKEINTKLNNEQLSKSIKAAEKDVATKAVPPKATL